MRKSGEKQRNRTRTTQRQLTVPDANPVESSPARALKIKRTGKQTKEDELRRRLKPEEDEVEVGKLTKAKGR